MIRITSDEKTIPLDPEISTRFLIEFEGTELAFVTATRGNFSSLYCISVSRPDSASLSILRVLLNGFEKKLGVKIKQILQVSGLPLIKLWLAPEAKAFWVFIIHEPQEPEMETDKLLIELEQMREAHLKLQESPKEKFDSSQFEPDFYNLGLPD